MVESNVFINSNEFPSFGLENCRGVGKDRHRPTEGGFGLARNDAHVKNTERTGRIFQQNDTRWRFLAGRMSRVPPDHREGGVGRKLDSDGDGGRRTSNIQHRTARRSHTQVNAE